MMRFLIRVLAVLPLTMSLSGCLVTTHPRHGHEVRESRRECGPAHHWEHGHCVHNGNGRGNGKGRGHGHGHGHD